MLGHLLLAIGACLPVEGDRILIRDLAVAIPAFAGSDIEESIGYAPAPGAPRRFSVGELSRLAARKGVTADIEPVCFARSLEALSKERVLAALQESAPENAELELIEFSRIQVAKGTLVFPRGGLTLAPAASPRDPTIWRGRIKYAATQSMPVWAKVRVWISRPSVVALQDLHAGQPIQANQIRVENRDAGPFSESTPIEQTSGFALRRPIRAGQVIPRSALEAPADVTRGEMVGIEARYGAAFLKYEVRAEASGRAGDAIRVRNVESGKTFRARVVRKGWVAVEASK